jgi:hypothetical protein
MPSGARAAHYAGAQSTDSRGGSRAWLLAGSGARGTLVHRVYIGSSRVQLAREPDDQLAVLATARRAISGIAAT